MKNASAIEKLIDNLARCAKILGQESEPGSLIEAARTELADLQSRPTKEDLEANVMSERATRQARESEGYRQALMDRVIKAEKELAGYTEIGPCGKHPKMFWIECVNPDVCPCGGYCSLCEDWVTSVRELKLIDKPGGR